jgi:hypothetical protein
MALVLKLQGRDSAVMAPKNGAAGPRFDPGVERRLMSHP